jgi:hypothetical protein
LISLILGNLIDQHLERLAPLRSVIAEGFSARDITVKDRYARALASVTEWCRLNLHRPFQEGPRKIAVAATSCELFPPLAVVRSSNQIRSGTTMVIGRLCTSILARR